MPCVTPLRSCKVTTLSWASQLDIDAQLKAAQGHHATVDVGKSVRKYRRDDVLPQLNCQHRLLGAIGKGWRPVTPLQRGVVILDDAQGFVPTCDADADTEPEVSGDEVEQLADDCPMQAFDGVAPSDGEEDAEGTASSGSEECLASADELDCDSEDGSDYVGPWIVNLSSGLFHKACEDPCGHKGISWRGKSWRRACRPSAVLCGLYALRAALLPTQRLRTDGGCWGTSPGPRGSFFDRAGHLTEEVEKAEGGRLGVCGGMQRIEAPK